MKITINGEEQILEASINIAALVKNLQLEPDRVAIEKNLEIVAIEEYDSTYINEGDKIEIVQFIGGG